MPCRPIKAVENVGAPGARPLPLGPKHEAVDRKRVLAGGKELRQRHPPGFAVRPSGLEDLVLLKLATRWQSSVLGRDAFVEQGVARLAIDGAFVRKVDVVKRRFCDCAHCAVSSIVLTDCVAGSRRVLQHRWTDRQSCVALTA